MIDLGARGEVLALHMDAEQRVRAGRVLVHVGGGRGSEGLGNLNPFQPNVPLVEHLNI